MEDFGARCLFEISRHPENEPEPDSGGDECKTLALPRRNCSAARDPNGTEGLDPGARKRQPGAVHSGSDGLRGTSFM